MSKLDGRLDGRKVEKISKDETIIVSFSDNTRLLERATERAINEAIRRFRIDDCGYSEVVEGWDRGSCSIRMSFDGVEMSGGNDGVDLSRQVHLVVRKGRRVSKVSISIECADQELVESATAIIINSARRAGARPNGPFLLPTKVDHYAVIRSDGRKERFVVSTHRRAVRLEDSKPKAMAGLVGLELPSGVEIRVIDGRSSRRAR